MPPTPKGDSIWYGPSNAELLGESLLRYRLGFFEPVAAHKCGHQPSFTSVIAGGVSFGFGNGFAAALALTPERCVSNSIDAGHSNNRCDNARQSEISSYQQVLSVVSGVRRRGAAGEQGN